MRRIKKILRDISGPIKILGLYHFLLAWGSSVVFRHPSRKLTVVGVTGTKGKSTVIELINAILKEAGESVVLSSSIRLQVGEKSWSNTTGNTMPGRGFLQKLMRQGVDAGCKYALLEVVSEGVLQYRHRFIDFDVAVFTGLHAEHIESHGSIEKYRAAKVRFFQDIRRFSNKKPKHFIVNSNNVHTPHFTNVIDDNDIVRYGKYSGKLKLVGDFNRENAAAAAAVAKAIGIKENIIEKALAEFSEIPGRMEFVQKTPFAVVVDYAHTPDSLDAVYGTLTKIKPKNSKMICVLGSAGGGRDKWKRPKLGAIADRYCEEIILTNEDPFDENPAAIISDVKSGIPLNRKNVHEIVSRDDAITKAISSASLGDVVIITGKGSEQYIRIAGGKRVGWSDKEKAIEAINKL